MSSNTPTITKKYIYTNPEEYINEIIELMPDAVHDKAAGIIEVCNPFIEAVFKYAYIDDGFFLFTYNSFCQVDMNYQFLPNPEADVITLAFYKTTESSKTPMYFKTGGHHYSNNEISMLFNKNLSAELFLKGNHKALGFRLDIQKSWILKNINVEFIHTNELLKDILELSKNGYLQLNCAPYQKIIHEIYNLIGKSQDVFYKLKLQRLCKEVFVKYVENEGSNCTFSVTPANTNQDFGLLGKALDYMEENVHKNFTKNSFLADLCNISESNFNKKFKNTFNQSPTDYFKKIKMKEALRLLQLGNNAKDVCYKIGYKNTSAFGRAFKNCYGQSPSFYLKK